MARYVFRCANDAHDQITGLFDFVMPTAIALWNLRWQVQGFTSQVPSATSSDLSGRFASGSGMKGGELRRACVDTLWDAQITQFTTFVLINAIAIFEDFTAQLALKISKNERKQAKLAEAFQFPGGITLVGGNHRSRDWAYANFPPQSASLVGVFNTSTRSAPRYSSSKLDNLLTCYRYFKEIRNAISHNGGRATGRTLEAYQNFSAIANIHDLGLKEVPLHDAIVEGDKVRLHMRGVIGLSDVILRIINTYDADLCESECAEIEITDRVIPIAPGKRFRKADSDPAQRVKYILAPIDAANMPVATWTPAFERFLKDKKIIPSFW